MLPIPSVEKIKFADSFTIQNQPIPSVELMERASAAFVDVFTENYPSPDKDIAIICGPGNNGGDGLCVARRLIARNYNIKVYLLETTKYSPDCQEQKSRLEKSTSILKFTEVSDLNIPEDSIVIDALFGSGLSKPLEGKLADVIQYLNTKKLTRVSIDMPSGLFSDTSSAGTVFKSDLTITFQYPKLSLLLPENYNFAKNWIVADIGLLPDWQSEVEIDKFFVTESAVKRKLRLRQPFEHKGSYGNVLLAGGSYGKMGAMVLCARASLRSGAGKVTVYTPSCGYEIVQTAVPEAMVLIDEGNKEFLTKPPEKSAFNSFSIGPGLGTNEDTIQMVAKLLKSKSDPIVMDADALNILSANKELLNGVPKDSILTPHPGEFKRLVGNWVNDFDKLNLLRDFCIANELNVVLKGKYTTIGSSSGDLYFNSTGNEGMATAGSGDCLTGIISSFLGQGYSPLDSAITGVYVHGLAGDYAKRDKGSAGMIAGDIIEYIPSAMKHLSGEE